jgi:hypothetical protein
MLDAPGIENEIMEILLSGQAVEASAAERLFLERHVDDVARLAMEPISDDEFRSNPLIVLLMMHGSRTWEDSLE